MIMPRVESRVRYLDHLAERGRDLFRVVCQRDAEGIVAKGARGPYHSDLATTSWLKVKNPTYSQAAGRHEFFDERPSMSRGLLPSRRLDPLALGCRPGRFTLGHAPAVLESCPVAGRSRALSASK